ncbi:hypothetical protein LEP1GSC021_3513 [Leptospira noguchii str. 1993005606]|nr:hypothetical protein LEP1GSC021_3513 [Leptospira noguchii str. 1993005606]
MEKFGRFFSIRKTYFLQVKRLILVGTLEKCVFLSLKRDLSNDPWGVRRWVQESILLSLILILKSYSTCG